MSTLFQRGGVYYVGIPTQPSGWVKRSTGTRQRALASNIARMVDELGPRGRRAWHLLEPVANGRLSIGELHDAFSAGPTALKELETVLKDVDADSEVEKWLVSISDNVAPDTLQHYSTHVRSLIRKGTPFPLTNLSRATLSNWLSGLACSPSTKRKYRAAMSSFCEYLISRELLANNPMKMVRAPRAAPPRMRHLEHGEVIRLVEAQDEPFRTISAVMHASGIEISAMLRMRHRDVDMNSGMVRAHGTKTASRDRHAYIMIWARDYLAAYVERTMGDELLFPGIDRWAVAKSHQRACAKIGIPDYTLRDSRHTFAVQMTKAGIPAENIAAQLGHADTQMVNRVYSRYQPMVAEQARLFERADPRARTIGGD